MSDDLGLFTDPDVDERRPLKRERERDRERDKARLKAKKRKKTILQGDVPSPVTPPSGCHFHTRCPYAEARCRVEVPRLQQVAAGHLVSCHLRT